LEGLSYEPFFIVLILEEMIIIGPTKKLVISYVVGEKGEVYEFIEE